MTDSEIKAKINLMADYMEEGHKSFNQIKLNYFADYGIDGGPPTGACAIGMACYAATQQTPAGTAWEHLCENLGLSAHISVDQSLSNEDDGNAERYLKPLKYCISEENDYNEYSPESIAEWLRGLEVGMRFSGSDDIVLREVNPCV
jgi:hypothetical protein